MFISHFNGKIYRTRRGIKLLDVRRQQIILDALFNALDAGLQQPAGFQTNPNAEHRGVARAHCLQEGGT